MHDIKKAAQSYYSSTSFTQQFAAFCFLCGKKKLNSISRVHTHI